MPKPLSEKVALGFLLTTCAAVGGLVFVDKVIFHDGWLKLDLESSKSGLTERERRRARRQFKRQLRRI